MSVWAKIPYLLSDEYQKTPASVSCGAGDLAAYLAYLEKSFPALATFFFTRLRFLIPEEARRKHTYILGGSGSGKSELMKVLIYPYIKQKHREATVFLFDPHGDVSEQVARWKEHRTGENLIYIDPSLQAGHIPCLNPLQIPANTPPQMVNYMAECLTEVFKEIVGGDANITANMGTMLKAVLTVLLKKPDSTLKDFQVFMRDEENSELVEYAKQHSPEGQRHFFESGFYDKNYTPTKRALYTKLQDLFNSQTFYDLTIGESTLNLRDLMESKKTVVFRLPKGKIGEQTVSAFGRFILAMVQGFSFQRQDTPKHLRVPTHIFLDEFHNFVTPSIQTILDESRKYGIHLTLVQQFFGQKTDTQLRASIMNNTAIKICGTGEDSSLEKMARVMTGARKEDLQNCDRGQFYIKVKKQGGSLIQQAFGTNEAVRFMNTTQLLDTKNAMSARDWKRVQKEQLKRYYREIHTPNQEHHGQETLLEGVMLDDGIPEKNPAALAYQKDLGALRALGKKALHLTMQQTKETVPNWFVHHLKEEVPSRATEKPLKTKKKNVAPSGTTKPEKPHQGHSGDTQKIPKPEEKQPSAQQFTPKFDL